MRFWKFLSLFYVVASARQVCMVGFDVAPELSGTLSHDDISGYVRVLVKQVNTIFGTSLPNIGIAWISPTELGIYNSSYETIAYYAETDYNRNLGFPCVRLLLSRRIFIESHSGIAYVGSACGPGIAAVFNVDPTIIRSGDYSGAWSRRNDAALTAAHEIAHTYGIQHSQNKFDFMYAASVVSDMTLDFLPAMDLTCLTDDTVDIFPVACFGWTFLGVFIFILVSKSGNFSV